MPVLISDNEYMEYQTVLGNIKHQKMLDSVRGLSSVREDIDVPMLNLVAMFALLECSPLWSCCGFDYDGQHIHKTHEYGGAYIAMRKNEKSLSVVDELIKNQAVFFRAVETDKWTTWTDSFVYVKTDFDYFHAKSEYPWSNKSCIHYPELAVIKILELERALFSMKDKFVDSAVLHDTNSKYKEVNYNWQYPGLEDWIVTTADLSI